MKPHFNRYKVTFGWIPSNYSPLWVRQPLPTLLTHVTDLRTRSDISAIPSFHFCFPFPSRSSSQCCFTIHHNLLYVHMGFVLASMDLFCVFVYIWKHRHLLIYASRQLNHLGPSLHLTDSSIAGLSLCNPIFPVAENDFLTVRHLGQNCCVCAWASWLTDSCRMFLPSNHSIFHNHHKSSPVKAWKGNSAI